MGLCEGMRVFTSLWAPSILAALLATIVVIYLRRQSLTVLLWSCATSFVAALLRRPDRLQQTPGYPDTTLRGAIAFAIWALFLGGFVFLACSAATLVAKRIRRRLELQRG
jgi:hypothetical protein